MLKKFHLVTAESLPYRDTKGESREAVLLALVVIDLHIKKLPPFTSCRKYYLVTGAFLPTERAIWERVLASPSREMAGEESLKKPPSKVLKGRGDSWVALDSILSPFSICTSTTLSVCIFFLLSTISSFSPLLGADRHLLLFLWFPIGALLVIVVTVTTTSSSARGRLQPLDSESETAENFC